MFKAREMRKLFKLQMTMLNVQLTFSTHNNNLLTLRETLGAKLSAAEGLAERLGAKLDANDGVWVIDCRSRSSRRHSSYRSVADDVVDVVAVDTALLLLTTVTTMTPDIIRSIAAMVTETYFFRLLVLSRFTTDDDENEILGDNDLPSTSSSVSTTAVEGL